MVIVLQTVLGGSVARKPAGHAPWGLDGSYALDLVGDLLQGLFKNGCINLVATFLVKEKYKHSLGKTLCPPPLQAKPRAAIRHHQDVQHSTQ